MAKKGFTINLAEYEPCKVLAVSERRTAANGTSFCTVTVSCKQQECEEGKVMFVNFFGDDEQSSAVLEKALKLTKGAGVNIYATLRLSEDRYFLCGAGIGEMPETIPPVKKEGTVGSALKSFRE